MAYRISPEVGHVVPITQMDCHVQDATRIPGQESVLHNYHDLVNTFGNLLIITYMATDIGILTHLPLVELLFIRGVGQHWLEWWFVAWQRQDLTWTNIHSLSDRQNKAIVYLFTHYQWNSVALKTLKAVWATGSNRIKAVCYNATHVMVMVQLWTVLPLQSRNRN